MWTKISSHAPRLPVNNLTRPPVIAGAEWQQMAQSRLIGDADSSPDLRLPLALNNAVIAAGLLFVHLLFYIFQVLFLNEDRPTKHAGTGRS
jgi:hypothetical protein